MAVLVNGIVPRLDIALAVAEEMPDLNAYVAHRVFPVWETKVSTAPIAKFSRRNRVERLYRPKYGEFVRSPLQVDQAGVFNCQEAGFEEPLDQKDREILGGARGDDAARQWAALKATQMLLIARDYALAGNLFSTSTFGSGYNTAAAATWGSGSDNPILDISDLAETVRKRCGYRANRVLFSGGGYVKLMNSAKVQSNARGLLAFTDRDAGVTWQLANKDLARLLGLDQYGDGEVIIANGVNDSADEGQTATLGSIWSDTMALVYYAPNPNNMVAPHLGRTFVWDQGYSGYSAVDGVSQQADPLRGLVIEQVMDAIKNIELMRAREWLDMTLLNKDSAQLLTGC